MARPRSSSVRKETLGDGSVVYWANLTVAVGDRRRVTLGYSREGISEAHAREEPPGGARRAREVAGPPAG